MSRIITPTETSKSKVVAALLSLCLQGGGGHLYLGQRKKGIMIIVVSLLLSCLGLDIVMMVFGAIDAYLLATRLENGHAIDEMEWCWQEITGEKEAEAQQEVEAEEENRE